jgi:tight adherence protein C
MFGFTATAAIILVVLAIGVAAVVAMVVRNSRRGAALERLGIPGEAEVELKDATDEPFGAGLARWLGVAGFRGPGATAIFLTAVVVSAALGLLLAAICTSSGAVESLIGGLDSVPGEFGQVLVPLVSALPWLIAILFGVFPILLVRSIRRSLVEAAERELPVLLELFATLAEAGLGFDAALSEILESDQGKGYLADEFRTFQRETLSGVTRVTCLRRLARRVDVPTFSTFVSSLVHAEQGGLGLSDVLRIQADDMRNRRRENALMKAQALPVKLVFPLVVCFLPALFVFTLGPAFYSFSQVTNAVTGNIQTKKR